MNHIFFELSAVFDTIEHDNVLYILEKYVEIGGCVLRLIRPYFCEHIQRVQIDYIMSDLIIIIYNICIAPYNTIL